MFFICMFSPFYLDLLFLFSPMYDFIIIIQFAVIIALSYENRK